MPHGYENGEVSGSGSEEEEEEEEEEAPPIPPRGKSLSPDTKSLNAARRELMNGNSSTAGHFLGGGRGGTLSQSPLSGKGGLTAAAVAANVRGPDDRAVPPSVRSGGGEGGQFKEEEEALLSELNELENMYEEQERRNAATQQEEIQPQLDNRRNK